MVAPTPRPSTPAKRTSRDTCETTEKLPSGLRTDDEVGTPKKRLRFAEDADEAPEPAAADDAPEANEPDSTDEGAAGAPEDQWLVAAPETRIAPEDLVPGIDGEITTDARCGRCQHLGHDRYDCPMDTRIFPAKFSGRCLICGTAINVGEDLCHSKIEGKHDCWAHPRCHIKSLVAHREEEARALEAAAAAVAPEVDAIKEFVRGGAGHALVEAAAGSGKTRLIVECSQPEVCGGPALVLVFNKAAQEELGRRGAADPRTFHALGLAAWKARVGDFRPLLHVKKSRILLHALYPQPPEDRQRYPRKKKSLVCAVFDTFVQKLVHVIKICGIGVARVDEDDGAARLVELAIEHGLDDRLEKLVGRLSKSRRERAAELWATRARRLDRGVELAREVLDASCEVARSREWRGRTSLPSVAGKVRYDLPFVDGDDFLYMPLRDDVALFGGGDLAYLFVDEAQDTNPTRRAWCVGIQRQTSCRVLAVGDPMQAVYGFAGADHDALDRLRRAFPGMETFPLSTCWRCPRRHVALANEVVDKVGEAGDSTARRVEPRADAPEGVIARDENFGSRPLPGDRLLGAVTAPGAVPEKTLAVAVVGRTNAPLLALRDVLASRGVPCRMVGIEALSKKLLRVLEKLEVQTFAQLEDALEAASLGRYDDGGGDDDDDDDDDDAAMEQPTSKRLAARDAKACLSVIVDALKHERGGDVSLEAVRERVRQLYGDDANATVVLSSCHRAKGLEFDRVYLLEPSQFPLDNIMDHGSEAEKRQERNLAYVAFTRAKEELIFLEDLRPESNSKWHDAVHRLFPDSSASGRRKPAPRPRAEPWYRTWTDHVYRERARAERDDAHDSDAAELDSRPEMTDDEAAGHLGLEAPPKTRAEMQIAYRKRLLDVHPDKQALKPEGERLDAEEAKVQTRDALYARDFFLAEFRGDDDDDSGDE